MLDAKIELLAQVPLFKGLSEEILAVIAAIGEKRFFEAGENIISEGEAGSTAFLIMTGKAQCPKIEKGEVLIDDLWPGTLVGELGMLVETVPMVTVTAKERLRAMAFTQEAFAGIMEEHPALAQHIAEKLLVRLHSLAAELREVDSQLEKLENVA